MPAEIPKMDEAFLDFPCLAQGELLHSLRTWIFVFVLQQSIATEILEGQTPSIGLLSHYLYS